MKGRNQWFGIFLLYLANFTVRRRNKRMKLYEEEEEEEYFSKSS